MRPILLLAFLPGVLSQAGVIQKPGGDFASGSSGGLAGLFNQKGTKDYYSTVYPGFYTDSNLYQLTASSAGFLTNNRRYFRVMEATNKGVVTLDQTKYWSVFPGGGARDSKTPGYKTFRCPGMNLFDLKNLYDCVVYIDVTQTEGINIFDSFTQDYAFVNANQAYSLSIMLLEVTENPSIGISGASMQVYEFHAYLPQCMTQFITNGHSQTNFPTSLNLFNVACMTSQVYMTICYPGTWLTCRNSATCDFVPMTSTASWNRNDESGVVRLQGNTDDTVPFGHCYPCQYGVGISHYNNSNIDACGTAVGTSVACRIQIDPKYVNNIYCPGGVSPPRMCPPSYQSNANYYGCVCADGTYDTLASCVTCPAGNYCIGGVKTNCPQDTYQPNTGATACLSCVDDNGYPIKACGYNRIPARCLYYPDKPNPYYYISDIRCVPCSECTNNILKKYELSSSSYIDCYI